MEWFSKILEVIHDVAAYSPISLQQRITDLVSIQGICRERYIKILQADKKGGLTHLFTEEKGESDEIDIEKGLELLESQYGDRESFKTMDYNAQMWLLKLVERDLV